MAVDIGPKIGVDGEKEFRQQLNNINTTLRTLGTEMQKVTSEFSENANGQEALRRKNEVLNKSIDEQRKKLEMVQQALQESTEKFGENSSKTQQWQQVVNRTETALNNLENELAQNVKALDEMDKGLRDTETGLKKVDDQSLEQVRKELRDTTENGVMYMSGALAGLAGAFAAAAESSREYRTDQAKLTTAFEEANFSADQAKNTYMELYGLLGEDDTSVEAANHIAALTDSEEELAHWTGDILPGVFARFGDSLPLEGLTEAANETARVGQVTGPLADALNWAGISEDKFNESLAACADEQERARLITKTLTDEYGSASAAFKETNAETIEANKAQARLTDSIARLGAVAEPTLTRLKNTLADVIETIADAVDSFNDLPEGAQNAILAIGGIGIAAGPTIKGINSARDGIKNLSKNLRTFFSPAKAAATATASVGTAATAATTGVTGITSAFKAFSAVLAANPIMLVVSALGLLATGIGIYISKTEGASAETQEFQNHIRETRDAVAEYKDTMSDLNEQRDAAIAESESEFNYYEGLKRELDGIVDKNGQVKVGYEQRAQTITSLLSDALGVEIEMTGGVIEQYDKLADSIDNVIAKKRAEAYMAAEEPAYQEAIKNEQTLIENLAIARRNLMDAEARYNDAKEQNDKNAITSTKTVLTQMEKLYDEALADYEDNNEAIRGYEEDMLAFQNGNYEQIYSVATGTEKAISEMTKSEAQKRLDYVRSEKETYKQLYEETGNETMRVTLEAYEQEEQELVKHLDSMATTAKTNTSLPSAMKNLASSGLSALNSVNWKSSGKNIGENVAAGISTGMQAAQTFARAAKKVADSVMNSLKKAFDSHSPSKRAADEIGIFVPAGIAEGEIKGLPYIAAANKKIEAEMNKINVLQSRFTMATRAQSLPAESRAINVTVYSVLDGKIVSKSVQKDITNTQGAMLRAKGALV